MTFLTKEAVLADRLRKLEEDTETQITQELAKFDKAAAPEQALKDFIARLSDRRQNLHIKPEFTPQVVAAAQQILSFGMAGLGLIVAFWSKVADLAPFWQAVVQTALLVSLNLTLVSFVVLVWFFIQARSRYPFLLLERWGNAATFFYYETLERDWRYWPFRGRHGILKTNERYLRDFQKFSRMLVKENDDLRQQVRNELKQYYLLIAYQGYLDQYEMQLEHIFLYGSVCGVTSALLACWWLLF